MPTDENGAGNNGNGMLAMLYNGDIVYSNFFDTGNIYAENSAGYGDTLLRNISSNKSDTLYNILGAVDDWLYYRHSGHFFRFNQSEGKNVMLVHTYEQTPSSGFLAVGDTLYFLGDVENDNGDYVDNLWRMDTDGAYLTRVEGVHAASFVSDGQYLYYASIDQDALIKLDPADDTEQVLLEGAAFDYLNLAGDMLYFTQDGALMKMAVDGTEPVAINDVHGTYLNVIGDWVYFANANDGYTLYRISTEGLYMQQLCDVENTAYISIAGGWVYFMQMADYSDATSYISACKVRLDGSDFMLSKP